MHTISQRPSRRHFRSTQVACVLAACAFAYLGCKSENEEETEATGTGGSGAVETGGKGEAETGGTSAAETGGSGVAATGGKAAGGAAAGGASVGKPGESTEEPAEGGASSGGSASTGGSVSTERTTFSTNRAEFRLGEDSLCDEGDFKVCENFEKGEVGQIPEGWSLKKPATVGIQADQAARGEQSLRIDIAGGKGTVIAMMKRENLGDLAHRHYGRMFYRIQGPGFPESIHFDVMEGDGPWAGHQNAVRFAATGYGPGTATSNWAWIYNVQPFDPVGTEFVTRGDRSAHPRIDQWMCLEWLLDADAQEAQYFDDGVPIGYLHIDTERSEIPVLTNISVGMQKFQQTGALRAWVDEVALDDERIGCSY